MSDPFASPDPSSPSDPFSRPDQAGVRPESASVFTPTAAPEDTGGAFSSSSPFGESTADAARTDAPVFAVRSEGRSDGPGIASGDVFSSASPFPAGAPPEIFGTSRNDAPSGEAGLPGGGVPRGGGAQSYGGGGQSYGDGAPGYGGGAQTYGGGAQSYGDGGAPTSGVLPAYGQLSGAPLPGYAPAGYAPSPTYPPAPGYGANPRAGQGVSAGKVLLIAAALVFALILVLVIFVFGMFKPRSSAAAPQRVGSTSAPIVDGDGAGSADLPDGISATATGQHYRNSSLGLDADLPKDWVKKDVANSMMYMGGVSGCSVILMQKGSLLPASMYNASLKATLQKDMPGITFGTSPAWAGPDKPSDVLEATSVNGAGISVTQYYSHFYRSGQLISAIETKKTSDDACQTKLEAFERSFRLK